MSGYFIGIPGAVASAHEGRAGRKAAAPTPRASTPDEKAKQREGELARARLVRADRRSAARQVDTLSLLSGEHVVRVDPYAANPLAAEDLAMSENYEQYRARVSAAGEPPKMFADGTADLPTHCASGLEPRELLRLPYGARHAAAAAETSGEVAAIFARAAQDPHLHIDHPGLTQAVNRVRDWHNRAEAHQDAQALRALGLRPTTQNGSF